MLVYVHLPFNHVLIEILSKHIACILEQNLHACCNEMKQGRPRQNLQSRPKMGFPVYDVIGIFKDSHH